MFRNVFADAGATAIVAPADGSKPQRLADVPVTYHLRYVHTDALGSPVLETNADGYDIAGTRTLYEPYGAPLTTPREGAPSYTGHQYDTSTGMLYAQQRYYDPQLGVFMSPDPMAVDTTSAFNFNRYAYANNSPYKFTDPDGRKIRLTGDPGQITKVEADLAMIESKPAGAALVKALRDSENTHTINAGTQKKIVTRSDNFGDSLKGKSTGSTIQFNPDTEKGGRNSEGSRKAPSFVNLAHELGHSKALDDGVQSYDKTPMRKGATPPSEEQSMKAENKVRSEHALPDRPSYY